MGMDTGQKFLTKAEFDNFLRRLSSRNIQLTIPPAQITQNIITNIEAGWPNLKDKIVKYGVADPNSTTVAFLGIGDIQGGSLGGNAGHTIDSDTIWKWKQTGPTSGLFCYWRTIVYAWCRLPHNPIFFAKIKTGTDISDMRLWIGLTSDVITDVDNPACLVCAFRYSTGISGNWYAVTDDGATLTAIDTGLTVAANAIYSLEIEIVNGNTIKFYINGTFLHTATTNLPAAATDFGWNIYWTTSENVAKRIYLSRYFIESN